VINPFTVINGPITLPRLENAGPSICGPSRLSTGSSNERDEDRRADPECTWNDVQDPQDDKFGAHYHLPDLESPGGL
jgi:hypothetical protein